MSAVEQASGTNEVFKKLYPVQEAAANNLSSEAATYQNIASISQPQIGQDLIAGIQNHLQLSGLHWAAVQQAVSSATRIASQQQQQGAVDPGSFVPGAISNRTLEHLTETMARPQSLRAIRGSDYKMSPPQDRDHSQLNTSKVGTIGDSRPSVTSQQPNSPNTLASLLNTSASLNTSATNLGLNLSGIGQPNGQPHTTGLGKDGGPANRSTGPADSDTSGISTGSDYSETALLDLMYNLNLGYKVNNETQTTPPGQTRQIFSQQSSSPIGLMQGPVGNPAPNMYGHVGVGSHLSYPPGFGPMQQQPIVSQVDVLRALGLSDVSQVQYPILGSNTMPVGQTVLSQPNLMSSQLNSVNPVSSSAGSVGGLDFLDSGKLATLSNLLNGNSNSSDQNSIEKAAKMYRNAAAVCEATCTWSGQLPPKIYKNPTYSCKVFLGGVPWDITDAGLQTTFKMFGSIKIEWPQEGKHKVRNPMKAGYVYVLFDSDRAVKALLQACTHDFSNGGEYYYKISSRRMRSKEVQVIPWVLSDSNYVKQPSQRLDPTKTVFVGALHGMMNAEGLANIMNDLFGNVVYAGIDTDKHKYPIGSGRVTFSSHKSFMKAVNAAFVEVKTPKFTKKIQIDPYLEDSMCNSCATQPGPYFCRDLSCFRYYCQTCWQWNHTFEATRHHKPLMRNNARANAEVN